MRHEYDVLVTAVTDRADLFVQTMESLLDAVDQKPARVIVHEDVRPKLGEPGAIWAWLQKMEAQTGIRATHKVTTTARGLGPAMVWCFEQTDCALPFYTQEDWLFVRSLPVARCLDIMQTNGLHHVRFNKRKTMKAKHADTPHPWHKMEVSFSDSASQPQALCVSDHWYTQASFWRKEQALLGLKANAEAHPQANAFVAKFNDWMNRRHQDGRPLQDQKYRHEKLKTYIWGPVGETAFIKHLGSVRTTGPIVHVAEMERKGKTS